MIKRAGLPVHLKQSGVITNFIIIKLIIKLMKKFIFFFVLMFFISLNGCGNKDIDPDAQKDAVIQDNKKEVKEDQNSEIKDPELKKKEEANPESEPSTDKTNELGMTPGMPGNFPPDIPQPKNARVIGSLTSTDGTMVTFESPEKIQDIVVYYKDEMKKNGYVIAEDGELITPGKGGLINWKKSGKEVQLVLGYDKDKNLSSLVITYK